jgi:hypothetical protein
MNAANSVHAGFAFIAEDARRAAHGRADLCLANIPTVRDSPTQSFAIGDQTMRLEHP